MKPNTVLAILKEALPHLARSPGNKADAIYNRARDAITAAEAAAAAPAPILAIIVESGFVSDIVSNRPELFAGVDVLTICYDVEGIEPDRLIGVPQGDGEEPSEAVVEDHAVDRAKIDLAAVAATLDTEYGR